MAAVITLRSPFLSGPLGLSLCNFLTTAIFKQPVLDPTIISQKKQAKKARSADSTNLTDPDALGGPGVRSKLCLVGRCV